jgi:hypothetical protein
MPDITRNRCSIEIDPPARQTTEPIKLESWKAGHPVGQLALLTMM